LRIRREYSVADSSDTITSSDVFIGSAVKSDCASAVTEWETVAFGTFVESRKKPLCFGASANVKILPDSMRAEDVHTSTFCVVVAAPVSVTTALGMYKMPLVSLRTSPITTAFPALSAKRW
jgi:hypothetical protein